MRKKNRVLCILVISLVFIGIICFLLFKSKFIYSENLILNQFDAATRVNIYSSKNSIPKSTDNLSKINTIKDYLKSIKGTKINKSSFKSEFIGEYYYIDIIEDSKILYQLVIYDNYISILNTRHYSNDKIYFKLNENINKMFLDEYIDSL